MTPWQARCRLQSTGSGSARPAAISTPASMHGMHGCPARSLHHRRGCGRGRPLGAGARRRYQRILSRLGATLSPLDGVGPQELTIDALVSRAHDPRVAEIVLALNATVDGQTTAHYITDMLGDANVKVTRLAHGVPVGGNSTISMKGRCRLRCGSARYSRLVARRFTPEADFGTSMRSGLVLAFAQLGEKSAPLAPFICTPAATAGSSARKEHVGLFSSPIRVGTVGLPSARNRVTSSARALRTALLGSMVSANFTFDAVYSWPQ